MNKLEQMQIALLNFGDLKHPTESQPFYKQSFREDGIIVPNDLLYKLMSRIRMLFDIIERYPQINIRIIIPKNKKNNGSVSILHNLYIFIITDDFDLNYFNGLLPIVLNPPVVIENNRIKIQNKISQYSCLLNPLEIEFILNYINKLNKKYIAPEPSWYGEFEIAESMDNKPVKIDKHSKILTVGGENNLIPVLNLEYIQSVIVISNNIEFWKKEAENNSHIKIISIGDGMRLYDNDYENCDIEFGVNLLRLVKDNYNSFKTFIDLIELILYGRKYESRKLLSLIYTIEQQDISLSDLNITISELLSKSIDPRIDQVLSNVKNTIDKNYIQILHKPFFQVDRGEIGKGITIIDTSRMSIFDHVLVNLLLLAIRDTLPADTWLVLTDLDHNLSMHGNTSLTQKLFSMINLNNTIIHYSYLNSFIPAFRNYLIYLDNSDGNYARIFYNSLGVNLYPGIYLIRPFNSPIKIKPNYVWNITKYSNQINITAAQLSSDYNGQIINNEEKQEILNEGNSDNVYLQNENPEYHEIIKNINPNNTINSMLNINNDFDNKTYSINNITDQEFTDTEIDIYENIDDENIDDENIDDENIANESNKNNIEMTSEETYLFLSIICFMKGYQQYNEEIIIDYFEEDKRLPLIIKKMILHKMIYIDKNSNYVLDSTYRKYITEIIRYIKSTIEYKEELNVDNSFIIDIKTKYVLSRDRDSKLKYIRILYKAYEILMSNYDYFMERPSVLDRIVGLYAMINNYTIDNMNDHISIIFLREIISMIQLGFESIAKETLIENTEDFMEDESEIDDEINILADEYDNTNLPEKLNYASLRKNNKYDTENESSHEKIPIPGLKYKSNIKANNKTKSQKLPVSNYGSISNTATIFEKITDAEEESQVINKKSDNSDNSKKIPVNYIINRDGEVNIELMNLIRSHLKLPIVDKNDLNYISTDNYKVIQNKKQNKNILELLTEENKQNISTNEVIDNNHENIHNDKFRKEDLQQKNLMINNNQKFIESSRLKLHNYSNDSIKPISPHLLKPKYAAKNAYGWIPLHDYEFNFDNEIYKIDAIEFIILYHIAFYQIHKYVSYETISFVLETIPIEHNITVDMLINKGLIQPLEILKNSRLSFKIMNPQSFVKYYIKTKPINTINEYIETINNLNTDIYKFIENFINSEVREKYLTKSDTHRLIVEKHEEKIPISAEIYHEYLESLWKIAHYRKIPMIKPILLTLMNFKDVDSQLTDLLKYIAYIIIGKIPKLTIFNSDCFRDIFSHINCECKDLPHLTMTLTDYMNNTEILDESKLNILKFLLTMIRYNKYNEMKKLENNETEKRTNRNNNVSITNSKIKNNLNNNNNEKQSTMKTKNGKEHFYHKYNNFMEKSKISENNVNNILSTIPMPGSDKSKSENTSDMNNSNNSDNTSNINESDKTDNPSITTNINKSDKTDNTSITSNINKSDKTDNPSITTNINKSDKTDNTSITSNINESDNTDSASKETNSKKTYDSRITDNSNDGDKSIDIKKIDIDKYKITNNENFIDKKFNLDNTDIKILKLNSRLHKLLTNSGILTIADLINKNINDLTIIKGIGVKSANIILNKVNEYIVKINNRDNTKEKDNPHDKNNSEKINNKKTRKYKNSEKLDDTENKDENTTIKIKENSISDHDKYIEDILYYDEPLYDKTEKIKEFRIPNKKLTKKNTNFTDKKLIKKDTNFTKTLSDENTKKRELTKFSEDNLKIIDKFTKQYKEIDSITPKEILDYFLREILLYKIYKIKSRDSFDNMIQKFNIVGAETHIQTTIFTQGFYNIQELYISSNTKVRKMIQTTFISKLYNVSKQFYYTSEFVDKLKRIFV